MGAVTGRAADPARGLQTNQLALWRERVAWFVVLAVALALSRWLLAPRYLITFDAVNFAFAVDHFDLARAQPQPPGYPVFVGLLKLVSRFVPKIETVFLLAGFLLGIASLALVWALTELIVGSRSGVIGALLLLFNPAFWLAALTNPVRLCLAAGSAAVALCVWMAVRGNSSRWLLLAAAALGFAEGARPTLVVLLAPLALWAAVRIRLSWKSALLAVAFFAVAVGTWLPSLLHASGGLYRFLDMLQGYSKDQFGGSSLLFGAPLSEAAKMAWEAIVWSCLGALSWVWAVAFIIRRQRIRLPEWTGRFLGLWFFPGLLFYALVHVGDPDHTLAIVTATCVTGAIAVATLTRQFSPVKRVLVIALCVFLNVFLFFKPISKTAKASTYGTVQWMAGYIADVIEGVGHLPPVQPVTAVFNESTPGWRNLSYYYPHVHVVVVLQGRDQALRTRHMLGEEVATETSRDGTVALPACGTIAWVDPVDRRLPASAIAVESTHSRVFFTPANPGEQFDFQGTRFVSGDEPCGARP